MTGGLFAISIWGISNLYCLSYA